MKIEADAAVQEVAFAVKHVEISSKLPASDDVVYLNIVTKENDTFCIELTVQGFRVIGHEYDTITKDMSTPYFETIYSLLDHYSPKYRLTFGQALADKLQELQETEIGNSEDEEK
ncbi:GSK3B-interacting protein-like [Strongylocentrotus purpuratus]|uniref:GSKIP domain-containing protein n=1 Tax=Strongylocentrotus purpuratus TaxID=7668 RepID=A0A7M7NZI0_STRPU|nr:GSK3B-interacting protein-like [Strongylocentrotus purpuratus]|eukprot:XP_003730505.2 PREDICTED: GSK3-beta interaction protein-like [Strongylocentrotus purpuratus]